MPPLRGNVDDMRHELGEMSGTLKTVLEFLKDDRDNSRRERDDLKRELNAAILSSREDLRQYNTANALAMEKVIRQSSALESKTAEIATEVSKIKLEVVEINKLKEDVASLKELKASILKYVAVISTVATILWGIVGLTAQGWFKDWWTGGVK